MFKEAGAVPRLETRAERPPEQDTGKWYDNDDVNLVLQLWVDGEEDYRSFDVFVIDYIQAQEGNKEMLTTISEVEKYAGFLGSKGSEESRVVRANYLRRHQESGRDPALVNDQYFARLSSGADQASKIVNTGESAAPYVESMIANFRNEIYIAVPADVADVDVSIEHPVIAERMNTVLEGFAVMLMFKGDTTTHHVVEIIKQMNKLESDRSFESIVSDLQEYIVLYRQKLGTKARLGHLDGFMKELLQLEWSEQDEKYVANPINI